jgi:hypothetical protein
MAASQLQGRQAVGREPPFREDLSPEAGTVRSHYQTTTSDDAAGWKRLSVCNRDLVSVWKLATAL